MAVKMTGRQQRSYSSLIYNAIRNAKSGKTVKSDEQFAKAIKTLKDSTFEK